MTAVEKEAPPPGAVEQPTSWRRRLLVGAVLAAAIAAPVVLRSATGNSPGLVLRGDAAWAVVAGVTTTALALIVLGLVGPRSWHYPANTTGDGDSRDLRIDMVRGVAIVFVILNHINVASLFQLSSQEALGPVSGAELFVVLSGVVLGMVYRKRMERADLLAATGALLGRAFKLYRTALAVLVSIFLVTLLPGVDGQVVTTFTDQGTGRSYETYPNMERLLDYPVPGYVLRDIALLRVGPFQFNIMGLYVALLALAPLVVAALRRRLVIPLLAVSWGLYVVNTVWPVNLVASQFEDPFPLLAWQLLFVHGLAAGWYRHQLLRFYSTRIGKLLLVVIVLAQVAMAVFSWTNPYLSNAYDVRLALLPDQTFYALYNTWFVRPALGLGRVVDVALLLVTLFAAMTAFWKPISSLLGWFLIPIGQATLYVFVLHVYFALLIANVPGLDRGHVLLNSAVHALTLGLLWLMVRKRFLFRFIPR